MQNISVLMSTYNETEVFLRQSIESILGQTYQNFEFIIILDNPENTEMERIILEYAAKDGRIRFYKNEENMGLARSLNRAIDMASCNILARMDADDIAEPELLEKDLAYLESNPQMHMVSVNSIGIDEEGKIRRSRRKNLPANFEETKKKMSNGLVLHPGVMYYKEDLVSLGKYRPLPAAQDYDLWLRYITKGMEFGFLDECLIRYRFSMNSTSYSNGLKQWICEKYIRALYKERIKMGRDSFSEFTLQDKIEKAGCNDPKSRECFNMAKIIIHEGVADLRKHKYCSCFVKLLKAFFMHKEMPSYIFNALIVGIKRGI